MHTILSLPPAWAWPSRPKGAFDAGGRCGMVPLTGMPDDLTADLAIVWKPRGARRALVAFLQTVRSLRRS
ncbi:hypothetical protein BMJ35_17270 [Sinorhizobium medicae]|nr:hypothetical protein BMJ35_17270 [Sinorhizobium medicae]